jgi:hypothetical protein
MRAMSPQTKGNILSAASSGNFIVGFKKNVFLMNKGTIPFTIA